MKAVHNRDQFSQSSACRLSACRSGPCALSGPRASWASRAARTSKPSGVPSGGELAIDGVLQHQVLDDMVFIDAEFFRLLKSLLVDQRRAHKSGTDHTLLPPTSGLSSSAGEGNDHDGQ